MDFDNFRPIYLQIKEELYRMIAREELAPGKKVPSVRDTAQRLKVNPNTAQRAYRELEQEGLFYTLRGQGTFLTDNKELIIKLKKKLARESAREYVQRGFALGLDGQSLKELLEESLCEEEML